MKRKDWLVVGLALISIWAVVTTSIYRFKHPEKSETELFLHIPKSFVLNFR